MNSISLINHTLYKLPLEVVNHILAYDKRFVIRNGNIIQINQIPKTDSIYNIFHRISKKEPIIEPNGNICAHVFTEITPSKDLFIVYRNYHINFQVLVHERKGRRKEVICIESHNHEIK
jgi:hypothetical protein